VGDLFLDALVTLISYLRPEDDLPEVLLDVAELLLLEEEELDLTVAFLLPLLEVDELDRTVELLPVLADRLVVALRLVELLLEVLLLTLPVVALRLVELLLEVLLLTLPVVAFRLVELLLGVLLFTFPVVALRLVELLLGVLLLTFPVVALRLVVVLLLLLLVTFPEVLLRLVVLLPLASGRYTLTELLFTTVALPERLLLLSSLRTVVDLPVALL
jgi:hypothetical protein